ncbi:MAG TPA: ABC transporter permease [Acidobacteriota bacterium]|jgi:putative ABC transport system permease protein
MIWLRVVVLRLISLFRKGRLERELDEELRSHVEMQSELNQRRGMSPQQARCAALRSFGGVEQVKEIYRKQRGLPMIEAVLRELRYSLRMLARNPGMTAAVVLTLTLAIGANTAIFSVLHTVLLRSLPYSEPDRLVAVWQLNLERRQKDKVTCADFSDWQARNQVFEELAYSMDEPYTLTGAGNPQSVVGFQFSINLFRLLGTQPFLGRTFLPEDGTPGNDRVVILSHRLWQNRFASDRGVVGRPIHLNGTPYMIVGVMPPAFAHPGTFVDLWTPLVLLPNWLQNRKLHILHVLARLKPGVSLAHAQHEMDAMAAGLAQEYPETNRRWGIQLEPIRNLYVGNLRDALWILQVAVLFMLAIACANVANMLLAQAGTREREVAIRLALGARKGHLFGQFLMQGLILALLGATGGLLIAFWGVQILPRMFSAQFASLPLPTRASNWIDWPVLIFTLLVAALVGIVFGAVPALRAPVLPQEVLKFAGGRTALQSLPLRLRALLIVCQVALSLILLVGSGLLIRSFLRLQEQNLGFRTDRVLTSFLVLAPDRYPDSAAISTFLEQALARLQILPGVKSAGAISTLPLTGNDARRPFTVPEQPDLSGQSNIAQFRLVSPDYFPAMGIPLRKGRFFDNRDRMGAPGVIIINERLARRLWPNDDPIGKSISVPDMLTPEKRRIVGVVGDVRHYGLATDPPIEIYRPAYQSYWPFFSVVVRTTTDPMQLAGSFRQAIWSVDKNQPVDSVRTMEELLGDSVALRRASTLLLAIFAGVAVLLAAVGIYGVMSYAVTQRTGEIGLRMALGAQHGDVLKLIGRQAMLVALIGIALGLVAASVLTRFLATLLYNVRPADPVTFAVVSALLAAVAFCASYFPARRATKVDPMAALRCE